MLPKNTPKDWNKKCHQYHHQGETLLTSYMRFCIVLTERQLITQ